MSLSIKKQFRLVREKCPDIWNTKILNRENGCPDIYGLKLPKKKKKEGCFINDSCKKCWDEVLKEGE